MQHLRPALFECHERAWWESRAPGTKHGAWVRSQGERGAWLEWVLEAAAEGGDVPWGDFKQYCVAAVSDVLHADLLAQVCPWCLKDSGDVLFLTASRCVGACKACHEMLVSASKTRGVDLLPRRGSARVELLLGGVRPRAEGWGPWDIIYVLAELRPTVLRSLQEHRPQNGDRERELPQVAEGTPPRARLPPPHHR